MERNADANGDAFGASGGAISPSFVFDSEGGTNAGNSGDRGNGGDSSGGDGPFGHGYHPDGRPRKRAARGSKSNGARQVRKAHSPATDIKALTGVLVQLHFGVAMIAKTPELAIDESEAGMLAKASADIMAEYGGSIDPRAVLWTNFAMACMAVYGPRVVSIAARKKTEATKRDKQSSENSSA